jgi:lipopolysaccharide transport protein LptA
MAACITERRALATLLALAACNAPLAHAAQVGAPAVAAPTAAAVAGTATTPARATATLPAGGIRIDFGQLTEQPGKVLLQQAVITEEDTRGRALKTIKGDRAESNGLDASNSTWNFNGNVIVTIAEGELRADRATVLLTRGRIGTAAGTGMPASFEQRTTEGGAPTARGRANDIRYDAGSGDLVFTGNVWFNSESTGEISSSRATYNIPARTSSFEKGEGERVRGTIRLKPRSGETERTP